MRYQWSATPQGDILQGAIGNIDAQVVPRSRPGWASFITITGSKRHIQIETAHRRPDEARRFVEYIVTVAELLLSRYPGLIDAQGIEAEL
jgi:hypothetical protein